MLNFKGALHEIKKIKNSRYCVIIGGYGTNNARSPKIWNAFFKKKKVDCKMIPLEIEKKSLKKLIKFLGEDKRFIGGSVTKPYKENIFKFLRKNTDPVTKKIMSINCLFKRKDNLRAHNTDGLGFYETLKLLKIKKNLKNVVLVGLGGAGRPVIVYLKKYFSKNTILFCTNRKNKSNYVKKVKAKWVNWKDKNDILKKADMIINCTSIGFGKLINKSPIKLEKSKNLKYVYDIIYNPKLTKLLQDAKNLNINTINGMNMNLYQAVYAIHQVLKKKYNIKTIYRVLK